MKAKVKYIDGLQFVGETDSGHAVIMDSTPDVGGNNTGPRPMELLLLGIGGCSGMDVVSILKKKKENVKDIEININGIKEEEHPKKFRDINIEFIVKGIDLSDNAVRKAVELSMTKYCSVKATLEGSATITYTYKTVEA
ncbi:MAG: osmotically inducible protein OsmC [Nitrospirae bacterium GWC2_42_7]|nr:MAG: osmotically inducible protein OsmC [Nitrospirae bacterium GWC2_42_7]